MAPLRSAAAAASALLLLPLLAPVPAAAQDSATVWAAVAYVSHGETTPGPQAALTPSGAQQLQRQGAAFRRRYLAPAAGAGIRGLRADALDSRQVAALAAADAWAAAGAAAFLQGLYPPRTGAYADPTGGGLLGYDFVAGRGNGSGAEYPLDGYQYPLIQTASDADGASVG